MAFPFNTVHPSSKWKVRSRHKARDINRCSFQLVIIHQMPHTLVLLIKYILTALTTPVARIRHNHMNTNKALAMT